MSPPRAARVSAWHCVLREKSPGWGIGLGGISCSIYCRALHSAILALSLARIRREFAFAEYGYLPPMQELFASRRKIFRRASSCRIFSRSGSARLILEVGIRRLEIPARPKSRPGGRDSSGDRIFGSRTRELLRICVGFGFASLTSLVGPYLALLWCQDAPHLLARVHFYLFCLFLPLVVRQRLVFLHGFELFLGVLANGFDPDLLVVCQIQRIIRFRGIGISLVAL